MRPGYVSAPPRNPSLFPAFLIGDMRRFFDGPVFLVLTRDFLGDAILVRMVCDICKIFKF